MSTMKTKINVIWLLHLSRFVLSHQMDKELSSMTRTKKRFTGKVRLCIARYRWEEGAALRCLTLQCHIKMHPCTAHFNSVSRWGLNSPLNNDAVLCSHQRKWTGSRKKWNPPEQRQINTLMKPSAVHPRCFSLLVCWKILYFAFVF